MPVFLHGLILKENSFTQRSLSTLQKSKILSVLFLLLVFFPQFLNAAEEEVLSLTLDTAIARAIKYNRQLKSTALNLDSGRLNLALAEDDFDIKIRPLSNINYSSVSGEEQTIWTVGGRVSKKFSSGMNLTLEPSVDKVSEDYEGGIGFSLAVPLLRGRGEDVSLSGIYAGEYTLRSSYRSLHRQQVNTVLDTVNTVYDLIREQELADLYREQLEVLTGHLLGVQAKERAGIGRSMDVYRVEIRIKDVEDSLTISMQQIDVIEDRLKDLVALPIDQEIRVNAPLEYNIIDIDLSEAVDIALESRVEMAQGEENVAEAVRKEKVAKHNTLPELNLNMGYRRRGLLDDTGDNLFFEDEIWSVGLSSTTDIARSAEKNAWAQSRLDVSRQQLQFETTKEGIIREVRTVYHALEKSKERIALRREQMDQAYGKQQLALIKFQYDEADNFDLIESQVQLQRAKANLMADEIRYIVDGYRLRAAMNTLVAFDIDS